MVLWFSDKSQLTTRLRDFTTKNSESFCIFSDVHFLWFITQGLWEMERRGDHWCFLDKNAPQKTNKQLNKKTATNKNQDKTKQLKETELLFSELPWLLITQGSLGSSVQLLYCSFARLVSYSSGTNTCITDFHLPMSQDQDLPCLTSNQL